MFSSSRIFTRPNGDWFYRKHTYFHAKCSINIDDHYNNYCYPHAIDYCMVLMVLFIYFLKLSFWINIMFVTLPCSHDMAYNYIMFILQLHEGNQSYWTAFLLLSEYLLVPYVTNYIATGCWVSLAVAMREYTDIATFQASTFQLCSIQPSVFRAVDASVWGGWMRDTELTSAALICFI